MTDTKEPILQIPQSVRQDTLNYRSRVEKFLTGDTSPVNFRAYRVPMGIYEQRTSGSYMVRIRIAAGLVLPLQLQRIAQLSKTYGNGILHITTRQDIQIHEVAIENTPDVLESLLEVGLSSRGGGGNTVRNVSACPKAGVCPNEKFDVAPYAIAMTEYLLQDASSFNLPRKYKIAFSGCTDDCALASVADLGFFAHIKDGIKGFAAYAAGGLGSNPAVAVKIEAFLEAGEIFDVAQAVKKLFDKYGDRSDKHKARLRYVLSRFGADEFIKLYRKEKDALKSDALAAPQIRDIASKYPFAEKSTSVRLWLKNGDISADDLSKVAQIAARYGQGLVRTTQLQDLLITGVTADDIAAVNSELKTLSANVFPDGAKVVTCTGAATCKLGLCLSRGLADAISDKFRNVTVHDTVIRISGCPNSCGHHSVADIGFQGKAKRVNGKLMPFYDVFTGAKIAESDTHLAEKIAAVPAEQIPDLLAKAVNNAAFDKELLKRVIAEYNKAGEESLPDDYYYDWGSNEPFSLAGRGPGECGTGVMDIIKLDIDQAKDAIRSTPAASENIYKAILASARALLVTFGLEPKKDREIFAAFKQHLIEPGWVKPQSQQLLDDALDWKIADKQSLEDLYDDVKALVNRISELFLSLDANLKFKIEPIAHKTDAAPSVTENHIIDLRGVMCPLNFVKAKLALEKIKVGDILDVLLDEGEPVRNVPASFAEQGQEVLDIKNIGSHYGVKVRRKK